MVATRDECRDRARDILLSPHAAVLLERQREVLLRRAAGWTLAEVGADLHVTNERVRQIEATAARRVLQAACADKGIAKDK